jgi:uncharacterized repeat protein (TIGR01451 family)
VRAESPARPQGSATNARVLRIALSNQPRSRFRRSVDIAGGLPPGECVLPRVLADPRRCCACVAWLVVFLVTAPRAGAVGTPAGTPIANTATATWTVGPGSGFSASATTSFLVDELINVVVTLQSVSPVSVTSPDTNRQLSFLVSNTGNGSEKFSLLLNAALTGDQFDPTNPRLFLDTNGTTVYEPGVDPLYQPGVNDPVIPADGSRWVFALCDVPASLANGNLGDASLTATSTKGTGAGTIIVGGGVGGGDAVIGASGGKSTALGGYLVTDLAVSIVKSATIADLGGGATPSPGATITYTLKVSVAGTGTVANLVITDPLPPSTSYVASSLHLNGTPLSDAADADAGDFGGTTPNQVTVALGTIAGGSLPQTITFAVTIN